MRTQHRWLLFLMLALFVAAPLSARADDDDDDMDDEDWGDTPAYELHGFVEAAGGGRVVADPNTPDDYLLTESRVRLEVSHESNLARLSVKTDFVADAVTESVDIDIREALAYFRLANWIDVRVGRQVLTWGTGDLLFINDLFPKDWVSFFIGREDEYLKAPSTTLKVGLYSNVANLDLAWTPFFESDRFITGRRLTFFNPFANTLVNGRGTDLMVPEEQARQFRNGEFAARLYRSVKSFELALYGYLGFWKQPLSAAITMQDGVAMPIPRFTRLGVYGASIRGPLLGGIVNAESAFYHSIDDKTGDDPFVPNHQVRALVGYEHELISKLTLGMQYYLEFIAQYDELEANSPNPTIEQDEFRHVVTARLTYMLMRDDLMLSLFTFFSPSEVDTYIRPVVTYKLTDAVKLSAGANIVVGKDDHTFFGRLEKNTNVYARARYTF